MFESLLLNSAGILTLTHSANSLETLSVSGGGVLLGDSGGNAALTVANGAVVFNGGWLGGYGTVTGDVTINSGGALAAGDSLVNQTESNYGGMTISGNLNFAPGGEYAAKVDAATSNADAVTVTGSAAIGGAVFHHVVDSASTADYASGT